MVESERLTLGGIAKGPDPDGHVSYVEKQPMIGGAI